MKAKFTVTTLLVLLLSMSFCINTEADNQGPIPVVFVNYQQAKSNFHNYILLNAKAEAAARWNHNYWRMVSEYDEYIDGLIQQAKDAEVSKEDINLLAHLIWNETGILGTKAMYYTGSVILNRMKCKYYPDTLEEVIFDDGQYAVTWTGMLWRDCPEEAFIIAEDLLINGSVLPDYVVFQAQFKQGDGVYEKIGNTYYCYWNILK